MNNTARYTKEDDSEDEYDDSMEELGEGDISTDIDPGDTTGQGPSVVIVNPGLTVRPVKAPHIDIAEPASSSPQHVKSPAQNIPQPQSSQQPQPTQLRSPSTATPAPVQPTASPPHADPGPLHPSAPAAAAVSASAPPSATAQPAEQAPPPPYQPPLTVPLSHQPQTSVQPSPLKAVPLPPSAREAIRESTMAAAELVEKEVAERLARQHQAALQDIQAQYEQQLATQAQELAVAELRVARLEQQLTQLQQQEQQKAGKFKGSAVAVAKSQDAGTGAGGGEAVVASLRREVEEQERLLQAYQTENKAATKRIKELESALKEATTVRPVPLTSSMQQVFGSDSDGAVGLHGGLGGGRHMLTPREAAQRLTEVLALQAQLQAVQETSAAREQELRAQVEKLRQEKKELEARKGGVDIGKQEEGDVLVKQVKAEMEAMRGQYQEAIDELQNKLRWYVENQELLTRQDRLVHEQQDVISALERRLAEAEGPGGRSASAKVAELTAQVAALQQTLRTRGLTKSLAAVIEAAKPGPGESGTVVALQQHVEELERKLADKDEEYERQLRSYQQQYEKLRLQFEERQAALQAQLKGRKKESQLTQRLEDQRSMYTRQIKELKTKLQQAQAQAAAAGASTATRVSVLGGDSQVPASLLRAKESEVARLQQELQRKTRQVAEMHLKLGEAEARVVQLGRGAGAVNLGGVGSSLAPSSIRGGTSPVPDSSPFFSRQRSQGGGAGWGAGGESPQAGPVPGWLANIHQQGPGVPSHHVHQLEAEVTALQQRNDALNAQSLTLQQQLFEAQQQLAAQSAVDRSLAASEALSKAREQAALEDVARWRERSEEQYREQQVLKSKVSQLEEELDAVKQKAKAYTSAPQAVEFALLEQRLARMEEDVAVRERQWREVLEDTRQLYAMQAELAQRKLEAGLAAKNVEVEGLRQRVDDLLAAAARWQQQQQSVAIQSR